METEELREVLTFKQVDFKKNDKVKKRLKLGRLLIGLFLLIIIFSLISKINLWRIFEPKPVSKRMIKPLADSSFEDKISKGLKKLDLKPESISSINDKDIEIILSDGLKILLTRSKDLLMSLTSLQLIMERFRIEGRRIKKIDLRFKNPIIE